MCGRGGGSRHVRLTKGSVFCVLAVSLLADAGFFFLLFLLLRNSTADWPVVARALLSSAAYCSCASS